MATESRDTIVSVTQNILIKLYSTSEYSSGKLCLQNSKFNW